MFYNSELSREQFTTQQTIIPWLMLLLQEAVFPLFSMRWEQIGEKVTCVKYLTISFTGYRKYRKNTLLIRYKYCIITGFICLYSHDKIEVNRKVYVSSLGGRLSYY